MKEEMIGKILKRPIKSWEKFKEKRPLIKNELDYAVVKELDDNFVLIDKNRLDKVYNKENI